MYFVDDYDYVAKVDSHLLVKVKKRDKNGQPFRRRCKACYSRLKVVMNRMEAYKRSKHISTMCIQCNKFYCLKCFHEDHTVIKQY